MLLLRLLPRKARDQTPPPPPPPLVVVVVLALFKLLKNISLLCNKKHKKSTLFILRRFSSRDVFLCFSSKKEFNRLAFLKKMEHPKHSVFCPCRIRQKEEPGATSARNFHLSLCFSPVFLAFLARLGLFFPSSILSGKYYFIFSLAYIFPHSRNAFVVVKNKLVRAIKHTTEDPRD